MKNILEVSNLSVRVEGRRILDGLDFAVGKGEYVAVTGKNGAGKSVLLRIIMGLVKADRGTIRFLGEDITALSVDERARRGIGLALQQPVRFKGVSVEEIIGIAAGRRLSRRMTGGFLRKVGLEPEEYLERELDGKLSGGEIKRIEIATLLARDAELLLLDEPEAGIDLWSFRELVELIKNLKKTIVVVSHQEKILESADRIVLLRRGKLIESSPREVVNAG